jgi:hypothetical protein
VLSSDLGQVFSTSIVLVNSVCGMFASIGSRIYCLSSHI